MRNSANNRNIVNDVNGQALQIQQAGNTLKQIVVNGEVLGQYGVGLNPNSPKTSSGNPNFATYANFNFVYTPVSSSYPALSQIGANL